MFVLWTSTLDKKREKCPEFGNSCTNCLKKEPFSCSMQIQKEKR